MREPKFRGFSLETKQWHYGHGWFEIDYTDDYLREKGIEPQALLYTGSYPVECELKSMGEFTGLKDKNGREIYEGDLYKYTISHDMYNPESGHTTFEIERVKAVTFENGAFYHGNDLLADVIEYDDSFTYVGNIYENPELLEGDSIENQ